MSLLKSKDIVIMGGTTCLGLSAAKAFIEYDAKVVVVGRNPQNVEEAKITLGKSAQVICG